MSSQANLPPDADAAAAPPPGQVYGVLAEYDGVIPLLAAAQKVRDAGYKQWDTYTPIPIHGLDEAMGIRTHAAAVGGLRRGGDGALLALLMQWWMNGIDYPYVVSGKPLLGLPAFIPIIFEVTILFSAITALVGMLMFNKLPALYHSFFASRTFAGAGDDGPVLHRHRGAGPGLRPGGDAGAAGRDGQHERRDDRGGRGRRRCRRWCGGTACRPWWSAGRPRCWCRRC